MSKPLKNMIINELKARYADIDSVVVVNPIGLGVNDTVTLRRGLREKNVCLHVVKNSLIKRALKGTDLEGVSELLDGSCALASGGDSIVDVAREIVDWTKKFEPLEIRGVVVEGQVLDSAGAQDLAKMPSRPELIGQVVQLAQSPGSRLAGAIAAPASRIAGCIKTIQDKLEEKEGEAVAA